MAALGLAELEQAFQGRRVFVTGHTGFKGSWLCQWLILLGAEVKGYALAPDSDPSHFHLLAPEMSSELGDIRDRERLQQSLHAFRPDLVFHLAAQPLVCRSYRDPADTFSTNVMGLVNMLDSALATESVCGLLNVTSDKCYENRDIPEGYRETDPMGGHDPYSASKGCAELVTASYRRSFFAERGIILASARAGNVVGGGDWSEDRLVPDVIRAIAAGRSVSIRRPQATRLWQHVLEPLHGYLMLGAAILGGDDAVAEGWNFGSVQDRGCSVREVLDCMQRHWPVFEVEYQSETADIHEALRLQLDSSKARRRLGWQPLLTTEEAFALTIDWYRQHYEQGQISTIRQIEDYAARIERDERKAC